MVSRLGSLLVDGRSLIVSNRLTKYPTILIVHSWLYSRGFLQYGGERFELQSFYQRAYQIHGHIWF